MDEKNHRTGDKIPISGNYQHHAIHKGHVVQRWWHRLKLQTAVQLSNVGIRATVLDIGSGSGILTELLPSPIDYTGVDSNKAALVFAKAQYPHTDFRFLQMQIDDLAQLGNDRFDCIFFLETIEHIHPAQAGKTFETIKKLLKNDGCCIITTPNRKSAWPLIERLMDFF